MSFVDHLIGLVLVVLGLLAPLPLAAALAGGSRLVGPGLRLMALLAWWMTIGMTVVLGLGWCGVLGRPGLIVALAVVAVAGIAAWRLATAARERFRADARAAWDHWLAGSVHERIAVGVLVAVALVWGVSLTVVPSDNYDTHMYQLPSVAEWLQHGTVAARSEQWRHAPSYERSMFHYPGGWNAWYALVLGLGGHERWAFLPNLLAWALFGASVRALARLAGATSLSATLAAALVLSLPITGIALESAHNDLALAAVWLAAVVAAVAAARGGGAPWLALAMLLAGMAVGIKPNGLGVGACAVAGWIAARWFAGTAAPVASWRLAWAWIGSAVVIAGFIALPWYVRNALETGNPLGFMRLRILGHELPGTIDAAYVSQTTLLHNFHVGDPAHWGWLGASFGVYLGLAWVALLLPVARWGGWNRRILALAALIVVLGWAWIAGPWSAKHAHDETITFWMGQQLRYTFALWGAVAALVAAVARPPPWLARVQIVLLWLAVLANTAMNPTWVLPSWSPWLMGAIALVFALLLARSLARTRRWLPLAALLTLVVLPWLLRDWRQGVRNYWFFGAPSALARLPGDRPIAFWATHQSWLLYGDQLTRRPVWLPLDTTQDDADLARMVRDSGCDHLAIGETWPPTPSAVIDRLLDQGLVEVVHGEPHTWGMKILRIRR